MVAPRENAAVNVRMERFDASVHHFREAGDVRHAGDRESGGLERPRGAAGRHQLEAAGGEALCKIDDAVFVRDAEQCSWHKGKSPLLSLPTPGGPGAVRERPHRRGLFFWPLQPFNDASERHSKQEEERCVSQARSSGSTTPKVTDSSSATEAVTCSCTTRPFRATASARSRKARRSSSRSLTARKARRLATSPRSSTLSW